MTDMSAYLNAALPDPGAQPEGAQPVGYSPALYPSAVGSGTAAAAKRRVSASNLVMPSLGVLDVLMGDSRVQDIMVNGLQNIFVDMGGQIYDTGLRFNSEQELWEVAERIMETMGSRWDDERPLIDTRLPDGSRVNIVAPPMAVDGMSISIRKFPELRITLDTMVQAGTLPADIAEFLKICAFKRLNIIVSGGTSSGKTTLLNALSGAISAQERIVTIEDSAELQLMQPHVVRLEAKPPRSVDAPHTAVTIRDLVKNALRMRPDRIVVGESRGGEAFDVLQAMNTGHDGSMTSLHANSPREALGRLETMVAIAMPQLPTRAVRQQIANSIHLILQMGRSKESSRHLTHISEVGGMEGDTIVMQDLMQYQEGAPGKPGEYRWVTGAAMSPIVTEAARSSGILRSLR